MKGPSTPRMCESRSPPPSRELAQRKAAVHRQSRKVQAGRPSVGAYGWNEMRLDALRQLRELQAEALELL